MDGHKNSFANRRKTLENFRKNDNFSLKGGSLQGDLGKSVVHGESVNCPKPLKTNEFLMINPELP